VTIPRNGGLRPPGKDYRRGEDFHSLIHLYTRWLTWLFRHTKQSESSMRSMMGSASGTFVAAGSLAEDLPLAKRKARKIYNGSFVSCEVIRAPLWFA